MSRNLNGKLTALILLGLYAISPIIYHWATFHGNCSRFGIDSGTVFYSCTLKEAIMGTYNSLLYGASLRFVVLPLFIIILAWMIFGKKSGQQNEPTKIQNP